MQNRCNPIVFFSCTHKVCVCVIGQRVAFLCGHLGTKTPCILYLDRDNKGLKRKFYRLWLDKMIGKKQNKIKNNPPKTSMSFMPLWRQDCWVNWFPKHIGVKAGSGARRHHFPLRFCTDWLIWGSIIDSNLPTHIYHEVEVDCVPVKLCSILEPNWSSCR